MQQHFFGIAYPPLILPKRALIPFHINMFALLEILRRSLPRNFFYVSIGVRTMFAVIYKRAVDRSSINPAEIPNRSDANSGTKRYSLDLQ